MSEFLSIVYVTYYISYAINLIGILQNLLAFVVFSRKAFAKSSIGFYGKTLALFDSFVVFNLVCGISSLLFNSCLALIHSSQVICKIYFFISMAISPIPGWILIGFSVDQALTISQTRRFEVVRQPWVRYLSILLIFIVNCCIYFDVFFVTDIRAITVSGVNETIEWCDTRTTVLPLVYLALSVSVPMGIIMITTGYIMGILYKSRIKVLRSESNVTSSNQRSASLFVSRSCSSAVSTRRNRDLMFGFNSAILNILFIVFTFPIIVFYVVPIGDLELSIILKSFGFIFFYTHFATHFWIFFLVNSIFRSEVLLLFRIRRADF